MTTTFGLQAHSVMAELEYWQAQVAAATLAGDAAHRQKCAALVDEFRELIDVMTATHPARGVSETPAQGDLDSHI